MYQSSEAFGNWIQQDSRTFQARITLEGKTITEGILSIRINGGSNSEDDFSLGSAVSRYVELEIEKPGMRFEGYEFSLELGLNGEYIPMGYFTAEKPKGDEERLSITAYDRMVKTERACFLELPDSTNTVAVLKGVGTIAGVEVVTEGLTVIPMKKPVGYTCREVLSYVAQLYGGFAICNRAGKIEIKSYEDNDYTVTAGRYWDSFTHNDLPFVLGKITCYTGKNKKGEDISIHVGDGVRGIYFSNPFMDQTALDNIWGKLRNYTYMPGSFRFLGDPRIDPWDVLTVKDRNENAYKVPAMKLTQEYDGGLSTEVEAVGKTEAEQRTGFTGPNTQNLDRLYAQLVLIDHAMINKLDVDTAKITYATIDNLNALKAEIEQLDVTELTARVAKIEKAYITDAEVKTLLAGYATIGNLNATNAQITSLSGKFAAFEKTTTEELVAAKGWLLEGSIGDAQISRVSANKLTAGTIDTAIITVAGSDGHLRISDNTIQIKDLQRVRVQIGKDASGEYSLSVWDKAGKLIWDALGATGDTIQRKIIRDKMVADDAAINALKLDLKSFNTALTDQGVTISGTVVQVGNKTLNVELTEQKQLTTEHGETLTDHAARITANENAIKLKVSTQEYESYKTTVNGEIATAKNRLNAAESSISVMKDQIALKVEQTDIDEAVNNIQVGARNLYPNSKGDFVIPPRNTGGEGDNFNYYIFNVNMVLGETYTIGADVEITHGSFDRLTIYPYPGGTPTVVDIPPKKRVSLTFTKKVESITSIIVYAGIAGGTRGNGMIIRKVKIETGNKATTWSPAIEDIEEDIAEVDGKFVNYSTTVQMNAAITAAKDSITSTVSRTYATKTEVSSVSGKVTSLESWKQEASQKITKDGILSTVGDYYATSKYVESIKTGSRNFLRNGNFAETTTSPGNTNKHHNLYPLGWGGYNGGIDNPTTSWHAHIDNTTFGFNVVEFNESDGNRNWKGIAASPDFIFIEKVDQEYRLSVDVYATGPGTKLTGGFYYCKKGESTQNFHSGQFEIRPKETNKWVRMSVAVPLKDDIDLNSKKTNLYIYGYGFDSNSILYIKDAALTTGNKTADWSPAPEETEMYIASVETLANQTSNKFLWLVKSGTSATNFELTDRTATLVANFINLKGLVTFAGLNSDTQGKISSAQNTANTAKNNAATAQSAANAAQSTANTAKNNAATAQSTANTAKSTADAVTSTVNANKANWDKGYNWTNSNGGNMINLLTMVKAWTGGAVSATTTINGGFIRTNTITAAQIALGDFTNLVDVNESLPQSAVPDNTHPFGSHAKPMCKNGYWYKESAASEYLALSSYKPNSFTDGDELYYEFTAHSELAGNYFIALWFYNGASKEFQTMKRGNIESVTTSDKTFSGIIKLEDAKKYDFFAIGIGDNNNTKIQIYVKNISVHKRNKGNLIVDGAITTDKLAAHAVTAAKINVKDLFAQDITATGTIRGVTLRGSKGEIGGFEINSTRLCSVDSSGTYAAYFGSYDFNKTNAFVAQTKVNGSWVNTLEMRYDGSIISRDKKNTNYRTTIQEGTVTCTGNDGWSTSTTVELRNGEIWFYRNKDSIEASIGFDEHGQNSNSATARVTRINASNSGLLLSCQNTPGLYIYKNSLRAWVNLDMNHKSIINSSDERLKTNILPFTSSVLPELGRLGIVSYEWKETGEQVKAGFTAQNMQSVFPELVEANDAGILGIKTLELMPYVVKGVQELTNKTEELQEQIKKVRCQQEGDTISLRAQVSSLQYQLQQAFNQLAIQAEQIKKLQVEG